MIPPEKLGRARSHDPAQNRAAQIHGSSADDGREPRLLDRSSRSASSGHQINPRACARARGGIHSGTGPLPVTLNSLRPEILLGRGSGSGQASRGCYGAESFRHRRVRGLFSALLRVQPAADSGHRRSDRGTAAAQRASAPAHREGKSSAEWVLLDYGGFVVHIFSERARQYYDLERLWRTAERIEFPEPAGPAGYAPQIATMSATASPKATPRSYEPLQ